MGDIKSTTRPVTTEEVARAESLTGKIFQIYTCQFCLNEFTATRPAKTCSSRCRQGVYLTKKWAGGLQPKTAEDVTTMHLLDEQIKKHEKDPEVRFAGPGEYGIGALVRAKSINKSGYIAGDIGAGRWGVRLADGGVLPFDESDLDLLGVDE